MALKLTSPAFQHLTDIPEMFTCEGDDLSPPLAWTGAPAKTESFALIVDDPDAPDPRAPKRTFVHWILFAIPPTATALEEGASNDMRLPLGARAGTNDWGKTAWGGPCPPKGRHRYFFKLYALDTTLDKLVAPHKAELEAAMEGHILEQAELIGTYAKRAERAEEVRDTGAPGGGKGRRDDVTGSPVYPLSGPEAPKDATLRTPAQMGHPEEFGKE